MRVIAVILVLLISANAAATGQLSSGRESEPVTLFREICVADEVRLSKKSFRSVASKNVPESAKAAIVHAIPVEATSVIRPLPSGKALIENEFLQRSSLKDVFMMLPNANRMTRYSDVCAIVWRGRHYAEAYAVIVDMFPEADDALSHVSGRIEPFTRVSRAGVVVGAAEHANWTVIYIGRDT